MDIKKLSEFIEIFHANRENNNIVIAEILISNGVNEEIAWKIIYFMPVAFNRVMFASEKMNFPNTYISLVDDNIQIENSFTEEEIFNQSILLAQSKIGNMSGDKWLSVAGRSAEFHVINELLKSGSQLKDVKFTNMIIDERLEPEP
jgi:hypothetical protein